jgi:Fur family iron response transcriptional regulator
MGCRCTACQRFNLHGDILHGDNLQRRSAIFSPAIKHRHFSASLRGAVPHFALIVFYLAAPLLINQKPLPNNRVMSLFGTILLGAQCWADHNWTMSPTRPYTDILARLRAAGLRPTRQRLALGQALFAAGNRHVTAEELFIMVADSSRVSLATVYNTLHQFTAAGLLREVVIGPGRSFFDTNVTDHHHIFFEDEERLQDIPASDIEIARLPDPPPGHATTRVDLVIRVTSDSPSK